MRVPQVSLFAADAGRAASPPKRLDFTEIRIGFRSHGHRSLDPCVLKSGQKAGGERAARVRTLTGDTYCRDSFFVHGDVVKVAEPILQATESVKKLLAPLHRPPPREQASDPPRSAASWLGCGACGDWAHRAGRALFLSREPSASGVSTARPRKPQSGGRPGRGRDRPVGSSIVPPVARPLSQA